MLTQSIASLKGTLTVAHEVVTHASISLARLHIARGDSHQALETLNVFMQVAHQEQFLPVQLTQGAAAYAQANLALGHLAAAVRWAETSGLSSDDADLPYPRERERLTLARVRIAQGRANPAGSFLQEALGLLDRLLADAEAKARLGSALEILLLQALAFDARGKQQHALATLERALPLAEPEGYVRLFVDEGAPLSTLLRQAYARGITPSYVVSLLSVLNPQQASERSLSSPRPSPLIEPLTEREREVLRLLMAGASNGEMAHRLVLSVETVKKHVANLYGKLGVHSRAQAIGRARALDLLE